MGRLTEAFGARSSGDGAAGLPVLPSEPLRPETFSFIEVGVERDGALPAHTFAQAIDRGSVIDIAHVVRFTRDFYGKELFRSYFAGDATYAEYADAHGTLAGYRGPLHCFELVWDVDGENPDDALHRTRDLVWTLREDGVPPESITIWYSGKKGFHLHTPDVFGFTPSPHLPDVVRATMEAYAGELDPKPLMRNGFIRLPWSFHRGSGLYKVPFTWEEITQASPGYMARRAESPMHNPEYGRQEIEANWAPCPPVLRDRIVQPTASETTAVPGGYAADEPVTDTVTCMQHLWNRGPLEGRRNGDLHEMCRSWRDRGLTPAQCDVLGRAWVREHNRTARSPVTPAEVRSIVRKVFERGYKPSCKRPVYAEHCDERCIFFSRKNAGGSPMPPTVEQARSALSR